VLSDIAWHPTEDILLTAGLDRKAKLVSLPSYHAIQEVFLEDLPIQSCAFIRGGKQALFVGNRKHYYMYDMPSQKVQKLSGIMGHDDLKSLDHVVASESKYYSFWTKSGNIMLMG